MKASLNQLHHQTSDWTRELKFYQEELTVLGTRLEEVVTKNTNKEVMAQVEHFQNKLIMLREQCDELRHDVNVREKELVEMSKAIPSHTNEKSQHQDETIHSRVTDFTKSVAETRFEFNKFLSRVL